MTPEALQDLIRPAMSTKWAISVHWSGRRDSIMRCWK